MIDWPNALVGFALGLVPTGVGWLLSVRSRRADAASEWLELAESIEKTIWLPGLTADRLRASYSTTTIDRLRTTLRPEPFLMLERLEAALWQVESGFGDVAAHRAEASAARAAFANWRRLSSSKNYNALVAKEARRRLVKDLLRHPFRTSKVQIHNRRVRRQHERARIKQQGKQQ